MIHEVRWRKSSRSGSSAQSDCVELARLPGAWIGVRDSKNPGGGKLRLSRPAAKTFLDAVRVGAYDL